MDSEPQSPRRMAVICVAGESDAGSARLADLLAGTTEIVSAGRTDRLDPAGLREETCSCGSPAAVCPFWTRVLAGLAVRNHGLPATGLFAGAKRAPGDAGKRVAAFASALLHVSGKRVALFSTGDPLHLAVLAGNPVFDLWVVHAPSPEPVRQTGQLRSVLDRLPAGRRLVLDSGELQRDVQGAAEQVRNFVGLGEVGAEPGGIQGHYLPGRQAVAE
jgi:hypothetical protein